MQSSNSNFNFTTKLVKEFFFKNCFLKHFRKSLFFEKVQFTKKNVVFTKTLKIAIKDSQL